MKRTVIILMTLLVCMILPSKVDAQKVKDAFVLVDVSGTMKHSQTNSEAKEIIKSLLQGNLSLSDYPGWSRVMTKGLDGNCPLLSENSVPLVSSGGKVCIIPFGDMDRVKDYKFLDMSNFESSFNTSFPTSFRDAWTYITLAKAYAVNVASLNGISGMVYMIIYSDGAEESMNGNIGYKSEYRNIVDYFGTCNDSFCQKKGIIRKSVNNKDFDIEIWTMGPIPPPPGCPKCGQDPCICPPPPKKLEISKPSNGKSHKDPIEIRIKEPITLQWKNSDGKTKVNIRQYKDGSYKNIPVNDQSNYYAKEKKGNTVSITFYEPQNYEVIIADDDNKDIRYILVKGKPIIVTLLPFLIIIIIIVGGVYLWDKIKPNPGPGPVPNHSNNEEW